MVKGFDSYPITWDGDPREKQAYLKEDWIDILPAQSASPTESTK